MQAPAETTGADDVLDLTDALNEDGSVQRLAPLGTVSVDSEAELTPVPSDSARVEPAEAIVVEAKPAEARPRTEAEAAQPKLVEAKPVEATLTTDHPVPTEASPKPDRAVDGDPSPPAAPPPGVNDERLVSEVAMLAAATAFGRLASVPRARREPPLVAAARLTRSCASCCARCCRLGSTRTCPASSSGWFRRKSRGFLRVPGPAERAPPVAAAAAAGFVSSIQAFRNC